MTCVKDCRATFEDEVKSDNNKRNDASEFRKLCINHERTRTKPVCKINQENDCDAVCRL